MTTSTGSESLALFGATSLVGELLLTELATHGWKVTALSRNAPEKKSTGDISWHTLASTGSGKKSACPLNHLRKEYLLSVAPIWILPDYFPDMEQMGLRRIVALSSTSRYTKINAADPAEQAVALRLAEAETRLQQWAERHNIEWVILRPTLIYGLGRDKNVSEIARFIRRFGFFPLLGSAGGLRQPIHARDVATACIAALRAEQARNCSYNISGKEILSYREMVERIFTALGRRPRIFIVPLWFFRFAIAVLRILPRYRLWSSSMAMRMEQDLVFDDVQACRDLHFQARSFNLDAKDLPPN